MEPIDFVGALRRSWKLLVALAFVGAVIAVLLPVSKVSKANKPLAWQASAVVGSVPASKGSLLGGGLTSQQIVFYATSNSVQKGTAVLAKIKAPSYGYYRYMEATLAAPGTTSLKSATGTTVPLKRNSATVVLLTGFGKTPTAAINTANDYAYVLSAHVQAAAQASADAQAAAAAAKAANSSSTKSNSDSGSSDSSTPVSSGLVLQQPAQFATRSGGGANLGSSRKVRLVGGLVVGALVGAGIVLLRELMNKRIRSSSRAESTFGFPVVVEIPTLPLKGSVASTPIPVDVVREPESAGAEAYRMLRMSVLFEGLAPQGRPSEAMGFEYGSGVLLDAPAPETARPVAALGERQVVMVVSAGTEPSRPHVAANLAAIYGEAGQRVIVVSTGDVEAVSGVRLVDSRPKVIRREDVEAQMQPSRLPFVSRLPLGSFVANSGELVTRGRAVLDVARTLCDVVIVEVPPLLAVHHAEALAHATDVVLVVGECGVTSFNDARRAGDLLRRIDAPVLGVVLTNVRIDQKDVRLTVPHRFVRSAPADPEPAAEREAVLALGPGPATFSGSSPGSYS